jgi:hypothetical protein
MAIIATIFAVIPGWTQSLQEERSKLEKTTQDAKKRINDAGIYKWNDALRFLPSVTVGRRAPYGEYTSEEKETYVSASISLGGVYDATELARKRKTEKRKALRKIEMLSYAIRMLIDRKYLMIDQIAKMEKIAKGTENVIDAAAKMEKIENMKVKLNELNIEIESKYFEIEATVIEVEG